MKDKLANAVYGFLALSVAVADSINRIPCILGLSCGHQMDDITMLSGGSWDPVTGGIWNGSEYKRPTHKKPAR